MPQKNSMEKTEKYTHHSRGMAHEEDRDEEN